MPLTDGCLSDAHPLSMGGKSTEQREDPAWLRCAHLYPQEEELGVTQLALASPYTPWKIPKGTTWKLLPLHPTPSQWHHPGWGVPAVPSVCGMKVGVLNTPVGLPFMRVGYEETLMPCFCP